MICLYELCWLIVVVNLVLILSLCLCLVFGCWLRMILRMVLGYCRFGYGVSDLSKFYGLIWFTRGDFCFYFLK